MIDLLIVEDQEPVRELLERFADMDCLSVASFSSGIAAREYLKDQDRMSFPNGYLVDMKLANPESRSPELTAPLEIYRHLVERGADLEYFRFMTGHISRKDEEVLAATGAEVFTKPIDLRILHLFFDMIKSKRHALNPGLVVKLSKQIAIR